MVTVLMTLIGWSSVPLFITHFSHAIDVWTSNGWRYGFSALLWAPVLMLGGWGGWKQRMRLPRGLWKAAAVPAVLNAVGQAGFAWSFYNLDPATATFGMRMQIVFVAVGAYLLFPTERAVLRSPWSWLGMVLVLSGVLGTALLRDSTDVPTPVAGSVSPAFGLGLAIFAGLCFAAYGLSVRKCMHGFHPVTAFAAISQITAAITVALMFVLARDPRSGVMDFGASALGLSAGQFGLLLLSAVIGIALGHVFYYISLARLGVAVTSAILQLQPFCVAVAQFMIFGKLLTNGQWVSGAGAVAGACLLLYVQWTLTRARRPIGKQVLDERIAGDAPVGIEVAEGDAVPVEITDGSSSSR